MEDYWLEFAKVALAHFLAVVSPGPDFAVVLRQSLSFGRRAGRWTSIGIGTAILIHVSYSLLGIGLLIRGSPTWFAALKYLGAAYMAWIGVQALRAKPGETRTGHVGGQLNPSPSATASFLTGFMTNALNPKATLFFIALFATLINPVTPKSIQAGYGLWMAAATTAWFCLVSALVSRAGVRRGFEHYGHWINRALGLVLLGFALSLAFAEL